VPTPPEPPPPSRPPAQLVARNWRTLTFRVCTRASLMCVLLNLTKRAAKRAAARRPRVRAAVDYVCDVLFPTEFYGPLMGVGLVALQGVRELIAECEAASPA
jgi:hypothetical protein